MNWIYIFLSPQFCLKNVIISGFEEIVNVLYSKIAILYTYILFKKNIISHYVCCILRQCMENTVYILYRKTRD